MIEEVFEKLLYSLHQMGREQSGDAWESQISNSLEMLREEYDELTVENRGEIDYESLSTQTAYVYAYAIGRAEFTYQLLKRYRVELGQPIFRNKEARITSLGGGPGSEIAGVVKYLLDSANGENVKSIKYWVFAAKLCDSPPRRSMSDVKSSA